MTSWRLPPETGSPPRSGSEWLASRTSALVGGKSAYEKGRLRNPQVPEGRTQEEQPAWHGGQRS